jgi:hypothetical protein
MRRTPDRLIRQFCSTAPNPEVEAIKEKFQALNEFVTSHNGWITSIPGAVMVTVECLPNSTLPGELRKAGYDVSDIGEGERILPTAIIERFVARADGEFEPMTEGSTKPIASTVTHAGICKVKQYTFSLP